MRGQTDQDPVQEVRQGQTGKRKLKVWFFLVKCKYLKPGNRERERLNEKTDVR